MLSSHFKLRSVESGEKKKGEHGLENCDVGDGHGTSAFWKTGAFLPDPLEEGGEPKFLFLH